MDISIRAIVVGASSDIGTALCRDWLEKRWVVSGTYRKHSGAIDELQSVGIEMIHADLSDARSVDRSCDQILKGSSPWDVLVLGPGIQDPVGKFPDCDFDEWERSIQINFTAQLRFVHRLLSARRMGGQNPPTVLFFAGGGTNSAPQHYSAYTVSKIALIKMTELLDAEVPDTRFVIVGPGWVKTKIHESTLKAGFQKAGENYQKTLEKLASDECTPISRVVDCCNWLIQASKAQVGGRNFSVVFDAWGSTELGQRLEISQDMYKLRRFGN